MPDDDYRAFTGTTKGSHQWVKLNRYSSISEPLLMLKQQGFQLIGADLTHTSRHYKSIDYTQATAIVLGAEKTGLSAESCQYIDHFVNVPMVGMVESFNVSVAAGIILSEALDQKLKAGHYQQQQLADHEYEQLFFEWAHPKIAKFCRKKSLDYPPVDDHGEIIQASKWLKENHESV